MQRLYRLYRQRLYETFGDDRLAFLGLFVGMVVISARKTEFTDSGVVKT